MKKFCSILLVFILALALCAAAAEGETAKIRVPADTEFPEDLKNPEDPVLQARLRQQEAFFRSETIGQYTKADGEYLLGRLEDAVNSYITEAEYYIDQ